MMRELDKTKVYDLSGLTLKELIEIAYHMEINYGWAFKIPHTNLFYSEKKGWMYNSSTVKTNTSAKELFYTLENIQVDCSELSEKQIMDIGNVYKFNNFRIDDGILEERGSMSFVSYHSTLKEVYLSYYDENKTTITYEEFMELFATKKEKPKHYSKGIDTFARMEANCTKEECLAFVRGNLDKYTWRDKGQDLEDFEKIIAYAKWGIKLLQSY